MGAQMTRLEQVQRLDAVGKDFDVVSDDNGCFVDRDEAIAAARLDNADAEARGYRQGMEDGRTLFLLGRAQAWLSLAKRCRGDEDDLEMWEAMQEAKSILKEAFNGARGIARVEIRQRLAEMEKKNG